MVCTSSVYDESFLALIRDELNVKKVEYIDDAREYTTYSLKPQLRTLGSKYGRLVGESISLPVTAMPLWTR